MTKNNCPAHPFRLRTIAAPLIAIVLVMTACGSDGPVEEPSITDTLRGRNRHADM